MQLTGNNRKYIISGIILIIFLVITFRLFFLQVVDRSYRLSASNNVLRYITQYPARGLVYDRNGELLVYNQAAYDLMVIPRQIKPFDTIEFCSVLEISKEFVDNRLKEAKAHSSFRPSIFLKQVSAETYAKLQEKLFKFPGFYVQPRTLRAYPNSIGAHFLGYVGEVDDRKIREDAYYKMGDYIGISGLERTYEEELRGKKGVSVYLVDVHNRIKGSYAEGKYDTLVVLGKDLTTSIDIELQKFGEMLMQNKLGGIVAIEPSTGEILAMISGPNYDPNLLVGRPRTLNFRNLDADTLKPLFNRPLMAKYPPGSTFKIVNALIGLEEKIVFPQTQYYCDGGYRIGRGVGCHNHPSPTDLIKSIQVSCNTYYCNVFRNIIDKPSLGGVEQGFTVWKNHVESFGFGKKLNIDQPNELAGIVPSIEFYNRYFRKGGWSSLTILSLSIGQGELGTTPLQMANMTAAIANRGWYYTPHFVKEIDGKENIEPRFKIKNYTTIDSLWYNYIVEGMYLAVNGEPGSGSTARIAVIPDIDVCGKTGTSQNPHGKDHSVFVAFAPKDNPKIAVAAYIENAGWGASWAAPIASLMIEKYLTGEIKRKWLEQRMLETTLLDKSDKKQ
ncbi:MAG: penicillin-binding protein 2 [Bacteroidales bacterium]|nr:penicillin-binding protein 2 [Bacteroidales bacterium]MDD4384427.1 penicillin-binding protein 2 [Bacteroidales bacterium]MDY0196604.1 penicillin-binding protein 2 [Tenuifilaceae bacterium]